MATTTNKNQIYRFAFVGRTTTVEHPLIQVKKKDPKTKPKLNKTYLRRSRRTLADSYEGVG